MAYRDTDIYRELMKKPDNWREDTSQNLKILRDVSDALHDIPALRKEYLYLIRYRIHLLFYVDCKPLLPVNEFRQLLRSYCRLTDEEYDILCKEYVEAYKPPMHENEASPRSLFNQVCHFVRKQFKDNEDDMRQLPLMEQELDFVQWKPKLEKNVSLRHIVPEF